MANPGSISSNKTNSSTYNAIDGIPKIAHAGIGGMLGNGVVNCAIKRGLDMIFDWATTPNSQSRFDSYPLAAEPHPSYQDLLPPTKQKQIHDAVVASHNINTYKQNQTGLEALLNSGWTVHGTSNDQRDHIISNLDKDYHDHLQQYTKQGIAAFKSMELEHKKSTVIKDLTPHYCLCLVNDEKRTVMQINMGCSTFEGFWVSQKDVKDVVHCGRGWKEFADSKDYTFLVTGENFGGICAHIVAMEVGGHAISVDMAPIKQEFLRDFFGNQFNIRDINDDNHVMLTSHPDQFNQGNSFGTILAFNDYISDKNKMIEEIHAGHLNVLKGKIPLETTQIPVAQPTEPNNSLDTAREEILRSWINELKENTGAFMNLNIQCISEEVLKNDLPLTPEQLNSIELTLNSIDQVDIPKMSDTGKIANGILNELLSKLKGISKEEYGQKVMTIANEVTAALYQARRQELAQKGVQLQREQQIKTFDAQKKMTDAMHHNDFINLPFPAIERLAWQTIHPSGSIHRTLKESDRYFEEYKKTHFQLKEMFAERKRLEGSINANKAKFEPLDHFIKSKFQSLLKARDKAIQKYGKAQTGLGIVGSIFTSAASVLYPPAAPFLEGGFKLAQNGVGMGGTHHERKRMKIEYAFVNAMNRNQEIRQTMANQMYQVKGEKHSIEQMQAAQRHSLFHANAYTNPAKLREQLAVEKTSITDTIKDKESLQNNKRNRIDTLNKEKETYLNKINRADALEKEINELKDQRKKEQKIANKNLPNLVSRSQGRKKIPGEVKKAEENVANLTAQIALKERELAILRRIDNTPIELKVIEITNEINQTTLDVNNLEQEITDLKQDDSKLDHMIAREARLASTKEYFFTVISNEVRKYNAIDDETAEYQETLEDWYTLYHAARRCEREVVGAAFGTFDRFFHELSTSPLFHGVLNIVPFIPDKARAKIQHLPVLFQYLTKLADQSYRIYDAYLNFKLTDDFLKKEGLAAYTFEGRGFKFSFDGIKNSIINVPYLQEGLGKLNNLIDRYTTLGEGLKKFGVLRYVKEYLLPSFEIFTGTLALYRLAFCARVESIEEQKINVIIQFLGDFSKHLDEQFRCIQMLLDKNHKEVLEQINLMKSELTVASNEIISEIESSKKEILAEQQNNHYNDHNVAIKRIGEGIARDKTTLEMRLKNHQNQNEEDILAYFEKINADLIHVTALDVNTGINLIEGMQQTTALVNIKCVQRNPDMYTGLIASKIKFGKKVSSLYLLNLTYENYLFALNASEPYLNNERLFKTIVECTRLICDQANDLNELSGQLVPIIKYCRKEQDQYIESLKAPLKQIALNKLIMMQQQLQAAMKSHDQTLNSKDEFVGAQKFRFGEIFCSTQIEASYRFNTCGGAKHFVAETSTHTLANGLQTFVGVAVFGPAYVFVGLTAQILSIGSIAESTVSYEKLRNLRREFNNKTLTSMVQSRETRTNQRANPYQEQLRMRVWITASGVLSSQSLHKGVSSRIGGPSVCNIDLDAPIEDYEKSKDQTPFDAVFALRSKVHVISNKSPIKVEELEALQPSLHVKDKETYDGALQKLLTNYQLWLNAQDEVEKDNIFSSIHEQSRFIPSTNPKLVPLAFPKNLLNQLENRMDPDRTLMEATEVGFLTPSFDFKKCENGYYKLSIQYYFHDMNDRSNVSLYEEFEVAIIDENTITAFAKPTYSVNAQTFAPMNEFLIQAMYTSFVEHLGMPGDQSVSLGGGRWVASSERSFPGFYKLWKKYPNTAIHFNSRLFTTDMSSSLNMCTNGALKTATAQTAQMHREIIQTFLKRSSNKQGSKVGIWKKIREAKQLLSKAKNQLEDNYHLLFSYCQLISCFDEISLRQKLEFHFGILNPKNYDSFYNLIIDGLDLPPIDDSLLNSFKQFLDLIPSDCYKLIKRLNGSLPNTPTIKLNKDKDKKGPQITSKAIQTPVYTFPQFIQKPYSPIAATSNQRGPDVDEGNAETHRANRNYMYQEKDIKNILNHYFREENEVIVITEPLPPPKPHQLEGLNQLLEQIKGQLSKDKLLLCVYNPNNVHWVTLGMILSNTGKLKLYYKDSFGLIGDDKLQQKIEEITGLEIDPIYSEESKIDQTDGTSCGIFAIENLRMMANQFKSNQASFDSWFKSDQFCTQENVNRLRLLEFANAYHSGVAKCKEADRLELERRKDIKEKHQAEADILVNKLKHALRKVDRELYKNVTFESHCVEGEAGIKIGVEIDIGNDGLKQDGSYIYTFAIRSTPAFNIAQLHQHLIANLDVKHSFENNVVRIALEEAKNKLINQIHADQDHTR